MKFRDAEITSSWARILLCLDNHYYCWEHSSERCAYNLHVNHGIVHFFKMSAILGRWHVIMRHIRLVHCFLWYLKELARPRDIHPNIRQLIAASDIVILGKLATQWNYLALLMKFFHFGDTLICYSLQHCVRTRNKVAWQKMLLPCHRAGPCSIQMAHDVIAIRNGQTAAA